MFWKCKEKKIADLYRRQEELEARVSKIESLGRRINRLEEFREKVLTEKNCRNGQHAWELYSKERKEEAEELWQKQLDAGWVHKDFDSFSEGVLPSIEDFDDCFLRCKHCHKKKPETRNTTKRGKTWKKT